MELYNNISGFLTRLGSNLIKYTPEPIKKLVGYDEPYKDNQTGVYSTARDLLDLDDLIAVPFYRAVRDNVKPQEKIWNEHVVYKEVYRKGIKVEDTMVEKEGIITMEGIESKLNDLRESLRKAGILSEDDVLLLDATLDEEQIAKAKELETYLLQEPIFDDLPIAHDILSAQYLLRTFHEIMPRFVATSYDKDVNLVGGRWSKPIGPSHFFTGRIRP